MNVLVICEDFRKDQYVLKPLVAEMMRAAGKPKARVEVMRDPLLGGVARALDPTVLKDVVQRYRGMVHLFLLIVDRDGHPTRCEALRQREAEVGPGLPAGRWFLAEQAHQEVEVWALAGIDLPAGWSWREVRADANPKERFFQPLAEGRGLHAEPGNGRDSFAREAASRFGRVTQLCPEVGHLVGRIGRVLSQGGCAAGPFMGTPAPSEA